MTPTQPNLRPRKRLGQILKDAGFVNETQLREALSDGCHGKRLGRALVERGIVDEETLALALSRQLNLQPVDLDVAPVAPSVVKALHPEVASRYGVFPLSVNRRQRLMRVATSDPTNLEAMQVLATHTGMRIVFSVSSPTSIDRAIRRHYFGEDTKVEVSAMIPPGVTQVNLAFEWPQTERRGGDLDPRLAALEKVVQQQSLALRGMLELLDKKGVIRREEFLARMNPPESKPPPLPLQRSSSKRAGLPLLPEFS